MNPIEFVTKWTRSELRERAASQEHFLDVCRMVGVQSPAEEDPKGEWFTFDRGLDQSTGRKGFADVWRRGYFAWEYKGPGKDLAKAYGQLQLYRENLDNPPLLVVCDMEKFQIHTNFTNTVKRVYEFTNSDLLSDEPIDDSALTALQVLHSLFENPQRLNPGKLQSKLTEEAADMLRVLADDMRRWNTTSKQPIKDQDIAHFLMRMIFCFFASDVGLLPKEALTNLITLNKSRPGDFR